MRSPGVLFIASIAVAASAVLAGCGQLAPPVDELRIQCDRNDQCPTDFFCSESGVCQSRSGGGPARLEFGGIRRGDVGEYGTRLTLPRGERSEVEFKVSNTGGERARRVRVQFSAPECPSLEFSEQLRTARALGPGESEEGRETVEPGDDCSSSTVVEVGMRTATQQSASSYELALE